MLMFISLLVFFLLSQIHPYTCQAQNHEHLISRHSNIATRIILSCLNLFQFNIWLFYSSTDKSYFTEEPTDTDVVPGGTIVFRCQARGANGQPLGNLRWTQDGKAIESTKVLRDGTLIIPSASPVHVVGWYQCHAGGGDTGQAAIVSRRARVRFYRGRAKPVILQSPVETEVEKGSTIRLGCVASGFPRPLFAWYKVWKVENWFEFSTKI